MDRTSSPSTKSASASAQPVKGWSVRKTLARKPEFRPIESEDVAYVWAAYRKGLELPSIDEGLNAADFRTAFEEMVVTNYDACWTMFADATDDRKPVGVALGFWSHPKARTMVLDRLVWFPWSSPRNRIESAVNFFVKIRHEVPMIGFARQDDGPFFVALLKHGMIRRVGTSLTVFEGDQALVYETRLEH